MLKKISILTLFICSLAFGQETQIHPYLAPRGGLRMDLPGNLISDTEMTDCQNVFFEQGYVKKRFGYSKKGDNLPLPGAVIGSDQFYLFGGSDHLLTMTTLGVWKYIYAGDRWETIMTSEQQDDCETTWTAADANVTVADDTDKKEGTYSQKISPDANFTTGVLAYRNQALGDKSSYGVVRLWVKSSVALTAGQLEFVISNDANCSTETEAIDIPAMSADTWYLWFIAIATPSGISSVDSLGLKATADFGAADIRIDDIHFVTTFSSSLEYDADSTDLCSYDYIRQINQTEPWWIMTNRVDELWKWTGSGTDDLAQLISDFPSGVTSLTCRELIEFKDHLLLLDVSEDGDRYPQRVRWSDTADPCDFLNGNASYVDLGGADWIQTAVKFKGDYVVIFKERSIWVGYATGDSDIFQFDQRVTGAGCAAAKTVESLGDELIFLGWDDVYVFNGIDYESVGSTIQVELFDNLDPGAIDKCFGVVIEEQKEYWLFVPSTGSDYCDTAWVFNYALNKWTKHDFAAVDGTTNGISYYGYYEKQATLTIGDLQGTIGEQTWRFGDREVLEAAPTTLLTDTDGYIYEYDRLVSNDDGTTIDAWFSTKDFMFTQLMERQVILRLDVYFDGGGDLKAAYSTDRGSTWSDETTLSGNFTYNISRLYWRVDCDMIRFRFRNNNSGEHFDFREARIYWQPSGRRF